MQLPDSASWPGGRLAARLRRRSGPGSRSSPWSSDDLRPARSSPGRRSRTPSGSTRPSAARPTRSSTCSRSPGALGVALALDDFDRLAATCRPLVEPPAVGQVPDGGLLLRRRPARGDARARRPAATGTRLTVTGRPSPTTCRRAECWNRDVIMPLDAPLQPAGAGTAVLRGNLAPDGAVIKQSAASPHLLTHRGRALVFDSTEAYHAVAARRGPRRRRGHDPGRPQLRPEGLPGHARDRQRAAARRSCSSAASPTWSGSATAG